MIYDAPNAAGEGKRIVQLSKYLLSVARCNNIA